MNGLGLGIAATLLVAATPSPSPALETLLAAPPSGFVELTTAPLRGHFTADDYASNAEASKQASVAAAMNHDGFLEGYSNTWVSRTSQHVLVEAVLAFTGGRGARDWMTAVEAADKKDPQYLHADTITGIDPYYGEHVADPAGNVYGDALTFVKGNDVFVVGVVSTKDDALNEAVTQTRAQYDRAPKESIPSGQWPENAESGHSVFYLLGTLIPPVLILAVIAGLIGVVVGRRRRAAVAPPAVQHSPDGKYWWDGQSWRPVEPPPPS